ncbi:hypothetical protein SAMN05421759_12341 [Roseivivax lentus]|uniref:HdeA/HdeB family protein n=1 Tax=Roseivivax lentus TaxID=633194 RepID=A0A1N7Q083_9RHOB|nr:hypothetical protein [Roseivivax lentus]SIT16099.1 hypothetical protein SAMN05421759_12341 [Roseivivax lentus]
MKTIWIATAACLGLAAPALAQSGADECGLQAEIVMRVVEARQDGADAERALTDVVQGLSGEGEKYAETVPLMAEWIYSLDRDVLGPAIGEAWATQCAQM